MGTLRNINQNIIPLLSNPAALRFGNRLQSSRSRAGSRFAQKYDRVPAEVPHDRAGFVRRKLFILLSTMVAYTKVSKMEQYWEMYEQDAKEMMDMAPWDEIYAAQNGED